MACHQVSLKALVAAAPRQKVIARVQPGAKGERGYFAYACFIGACAVLAILPQLAFTAKSSDSLAFK